MTLEDYVNERGYVIVGAYFEAPLGTILSIRATSWDEGTQIDQPFQVVRESTLQEFIDQQNSTDIKYSEALPKFPFYYEVRTD